MPSSEQAMTWHGFIFSLIDIKTADCRTAGGVQEHWVLLACCLQQTERPGWVADQAEHGLRDELRVSEHQRWKAEKSPKAMNFMDRK